MATDLGVTGEVLIGAGDIARCDKINDEATAAILDTIPGTVFTIGDNVLEGASNGPPDFNGCYHPSWGRHKARTRPGHGHREGFSPGSATYYDYFGAAAGERGNGYYSYDLGDWHVIVLNSAKLLTVGSAQEAWLRADLAASNKQCEVAFLHVPLFTSTGSQYNAAMKPAWDALYTAGADLIVTAHSEVYERFAPQTPDEVLDTVWGLRQIIVGTGGIGTNAWSTIRANSQVRSTGTYGVLKLTLGSGAYAWRFIPVAGKTFTDTGTSLCHGAPGNRAPTASAGGPYVSEGAVTFNGSGSTDPDNEALTYAWSFGDGTTGTGVAPVHAYAADGSYTATLVVTDARGEPSAPSTAPVTVGNIAPSVNAGADQTVFPGSTLSLSASFSDPGSSDAPWAYTFDWGDGTSETGSRADQSALTATHLYPTVGIYVVRVTVTDNDGGSGSDEAQVSVSSQALFTGAGNISACYNNFDESTASILDTIPGQIFTTGDNAFPDGTPADYANCYHPTWGRHKVRTRPAPGNHEYGTGGVGYFGYFGAAAGEAGKGWYAYNLGAWRIVVLNDQVSFAANSEQDLWLRNELATSTKRCTIAIWHVPLFLSSNEAGYIANDNRKILWDRLYQAGVEIVLNGQQHHFERFAPQTPTGVRDDATGIREFNIGTGGESVALPTVAIHPSSEVRGAVFGVVKFTLDQDSYSWVFVPVGGQAPFTDAGSGTCHDAPAVPNQLPAANAGGPYASESAVTFDGSASSDPDNDLPLTYAWSFGDGATGTGATPSHTYAADGAYAVSLTVTDARGGTSNAATTTATIENAPPAVNAGPNGTAPVGAAFSVSATFTDPNPADGPWSYVITWGDGATSAGSVAALGSPVTGSHIYDQEGSYLARVSVADKDGGIGFDELTVAVTAPVLVGAGDVGDCLRTGDNETGDLLDGIPGVVMALGDLAYLDGTPAEYANCFDPAWGRHKARMRPLAGNHDYNTPGAAGYFGYFGALAGDPTTGYYSFDLGTWHIIVLNSNLDMYVGSAQEAWLRAELAAHQQQCIAAMWHYPRFSTVSERTTLDAVKPLWNALYEFGADLILNGHDHAYQRFAPQTPDGLADPAYGLRQFAVGTGGGEGLYAFGPTVPNLEARDNQTFGVLKLTLRAGAYDWQFVPVPGGTFSDVGTQACHGTPPGNQAPTARPGGPYAAEATVTFDGSTSSDPENDLPLAYAWDFGDGATGSGATPTHLYPADGAYTVTLRVTDARGAVSAPATASVTIVDVAPVVNAGPDGSVAPGVPYALQATFTDPGPDGPWTYSIAWGDGGTEGGTRTDPSVPITGSHAYAAEGQYQVRVTVSDRDGVTAFDELTVTVQTSVVLVGAGDIARCDLLNDEATAALLDGIPGAVFTVGDNTEGGTGNPPNFVACYHPSWGRHQGRTRPALGHLEGFSPGSATYYDYFGAAAGERGKGYYSYDLGEWHVIVLNSNQSLAAGSAQEQWLRADLTASNKQCQIAMWHTPLFASTSFRSTAVRGAWDALYAAGAELIVNAHSRIYERFAPQTPSGTVDQSGGIREIIAGTGGMPRHTFGTIAANSEVRSSGTYGVLKLTLGSGWYTWEFVPVAGKTFTDTGSGTCH